MSAHGRAGADGARRIGQPADKKRRDPGAGEAFRRALQQEVGDGDAKAPDMLAGKIVKGGQGVWGPIPMPPNKVSDDEAKKLVAWILAL